MCSEKRKKVVCESQRFLGYNEKDGSHKQIIDIYNQYVPLPRGYTVKYDDEWCATYVSAIAILTGCTDIIPVECSCAQMINLCKTMGIWNEDDSYRPSPGDIIFYDWDDNSTGDCQGYPEHVGYVIKTKDSDILVIEGNYNCAVRYRTIAINGKKIRGYGIPCYAGKNEEVLSDISKYVIKEGDTLSEIALLFNQNVEALAKYNSISNPNMVYVGQTIYIPTKKNKQTYKVEEGDTLSQIALKFNTTVNKLAITNSIKDPDLIHIGQEIIISD